jgi:transketolase
MSGDGKESRVLMRREISANSIRRIILEQSRRAHVGHIGSALSIVEIITTLYRDVLRVDDPFSAERDRFILSKGHAALTLYGALFLKGWITQEELNGYCADATLLGVHPEHALKGVDFSIGSLGQGLSFGAGSALAARMKNSSRRVFVLVSDAECNEGSLWEAAMFAAHHGLSNLTVVIDLNGQQALGYTDEVLSLSPMNERWRAFGWDALEVDGHDEAALAEALSDNRNDKPRVVIAKTTFGKGVSYMEGLIKWHYTPMSEGEYRQALAEIGARA